MNKQKYTSANKARNKMVLGKTVKSATITKAKILCFFIFVRVKINYYLPVIRDILPLFTLAPHTPAIWAPKLRPMRCKLGRYNPLDTR